MSKTTADRIAEAVLYEGYILYPYRPCVKNRQRWTFGGLFPNAWARAHRHSDPATMQTQCLVETNVATLVNVRARFLHLVDRTVGRLSEPLDDWHEGEEPAYEATDMLEVGDRIFQPWQEAIEQEMSLGAINVWKLLREPIRRPFTFAAERMTEPIATQSGHVVGVLVRQRRALQCIVEITAEQIERGLHRLTVCITNTTPIAHPIETQRADAQLSAMASTHAILNVTDGAFVSQTDPPDVWKDAAEQCENIGDWPVLVGEEGRRDTLLASPIILSDYPEIAPESPGDLFDGTEIDEILTLRIMTMTDEEKRQAAGIDPRAKSLLQRTESLARQQLMNLHGTMRRPAPPEEKAKQRQGPICIDGVLLNVGDHVRLDPRGNADAFDVVLRGMTATITSIEEDFEGRTHLAVTIDADPGMDYGRDGRIGHRFFFSPQDVQPLTAPQEH